MKTQGSFLGRLDEHDRAALAQRWTTRRYRRREMIIAHDEASRDVFFVLEGRAQVTVYSESGKAVAYRDVGEGDVFGEMSAIDGRPRSASVMALDDVLVAVLPEPAFRAMVAAHPGFAWSLLTHLTLQMRRMTDRVYEFSTLVVRKRLIRELLRLAHPEAPDGAAAPISPAPTHSDLAARIGTHREAVSREMSALARRGLVVKRKGALLLPAPEALEILCREED